MAYATPEQLVHPVEVFAITMSIVVAVIVYWAGGMVFAVKNDTSFVSLIVFGFIEAVLLSLTLLRSPCTSMQRFEHGKLNNVDIGT